MGNPPHILVVDNDPDICALLKSSLEYEGFVVSLALGAPEARSVVERGDVSLAIIDVLLGRENGARLAQLLRSRSVPVILMTGSVEVMEHGVEGFGELIHKPFRLAALVQRVKSSLAAVQN